MNAKLILMGSVCTVAMLSGVVAFADQYPANCIKTGSNRACLPDNKEFLVCWKPGGTPPDHLMQMFNYLKALAGINSTLQKCGSKTDAVAEYAALQPNTWGLTTCTKLRELDIFVSPTKHECLQFSVKLDNVQLRKFKEPYWGERHVWCHELGHALGLGHETRCMQAGVSSSATSFSTSYSEHHAEHLRSIPGGPE